jgi:hypothetical protein
LKAALPWGKRWRGRLSKKIYVSIINPLQQPVRELAEIIISDTPPITGEI